jgi:hypothetical protein
MIGLILSKRITIGQSWTGRINTVHQLVKTIPKTGENNQAQPNLPDPGSVPAAVHGRLSHDVTLVAGVRIRRNKLVSL